MKTTFALLTAMLLAGPALAQVTTFVGSDPGADRNDPRPNTDAAAAAFDSAAGALGAIQRIDFENLPQGQFSSLAVAPGVTATQTNYDPALGGIVPNDYAGPYGAILGYNTTSGGALYLSFVPKSYIGTAKLNFAFDTPVQAWGAYLTGLEDDINGDLYVEFDDGTSRSYALPQVSTAGAQYFGFTDPGASIVDVALVLKGVGNSRDIYGVDDMAYVVIPEPAALALLGLGAIGFIGRWRRARHAPRGAARQAVARLTALAVSASLLGVAATAEAEEPYPIAWIRQQGTPHWDAAFGVAADDQGNVFISGDTLGSLGGPSAGGRDAFVSKYDSGGNVLWTRQLGTSRGDASKGVATDGGASVFITGYTQGSLVRPAGGGEDAFVSKYDIAGNLLWTRQLGGSAVDTSYAVAADPAGNVFIAGHTHGSLGGPNAGGIDAFVAKYDSTGSFEWTRQLGTSGVDESYAVATDGLGSVFVSGWTGASLGGPNAGKLDAFVARYDAQGRRLWTRQLGTSDSEQSYTLAADGLGNVFVGGYTRGNLGGPNAGSEDAFLSKFGAAGDLLWTRQLGTPRGDQIWGAAADGLGGVFVTGSTSGSLAGPNAGQTDAFMGQYDSAGNLLWIRQLGTSENDSSMAAAADGLGRFFIAGYTDGAPGGPNAGEWDAFVVKLIPEPATLALLAAGGLGLLRKRKTRRFCIRTGGPCSG